MTSGGIVAGRDVDGVTGSDFTSRNVREGTARPTVFRDATPGDINKAVAAASRAFRVAQFSDQPHKPSALLHAIAEGIESCAEDLIALASAETGLDAQARLVGELARTTGQLRMLAAESDRRSGTSLAEDAATVDPAQPGLVMGEAPLGPVAVFGASNFPFAFGVLGGDTAAALAAGCPVVAKGHPAHPETSALLGAVATQAVTKLGLDAGWFSLVQGRSTEVGARLAAAPELEAIAFTGSTAGGLALADAAAKRPRPIPVFAELGGINALYLLPGAAARADESFLTGLANSLTGGSGQFCTKPGLLVVVDDAAGEATIGALAAALDGSAPPPLLTEGIRAAYDARISALRADPTVDLRTESAGDDRPGSAVPPVVATLTSDDLRRDPSFTDEIFGPAVVAVRCTDLEDLLAVVDLIPAGLTATIHSAPEERDATFALLRRVRLRVGRVLFGGFPTGVRVGRATTHGGPYPATTSPWSTSVGARSIDRFVRPVTYQNLPDDLRSAALSWS